MLASAPDAVLDQPKKLIVNADDFGLSPKVNEGIIEAHRDGIVTAASCLVNLAGLEHAAQLARANPNLDLGLHLNLTWGEPLTVPSPRLAPGGRFRGKRNLVLALLLGRIPRAAIHREAEAQIRAFRRHFGTPSHLDVHQHFHVFPRIFDTVVDLALENGVAFLRFPAETPSRSIAAGFIGRTFARRARPIGVRTTDYFLGLDFTGRLTEQSLLKIVDRVREGVTELMVHPGGLSNSGGIRDRLAAHRPTERDALRSPRIRAALTKAGIQLTTFRVLARIESS